MKDHHTGGRRKAIKFYIDHKHALQHFTHELDMLRSNLGDSTATVFNARDQMGPGRILRLAVPGVSEAWRAPPHIVMAHGEQVPGCTSCCLRCLLAVPDGRQSCMSPSGIGLLLSKKWRQALAMLLIFWATPFCAGMHDG